MRKFFLLLMFIASMGMTGCGNLYMQPVDSTTINNISISQDEAAIVFFQPKSVWSGTTGIGIASLAILGPFGTVRGDAVPGVYEIEENGNLKFITFLTPDAKILHKTTPGKHLYFVSENNFMEAALEAGKTYYV